MYRYPCVCLIAATISLCERVIALEEGPQSGNEILLESFERPVHRWTEMNDPVMGGQSTGSFHVSDNIGIFAGEVVDVPFLHAPGFIQARTTDKIPFPDVTHCSAIKIVLRTLNPEYTGYRFSFGNAHAPGGKWHAYGYKTNLVNVPSELGELVIPFEDFTDFWDDATGDPIHKCQENSHYCPDQATLSNMKTMAVWGEGVAGKVSLDIDSIWAVGCASRLDATVDKGTTVGWFPRHVLRGWSQQLSLSTTIWNWFQM